MGTCIICGTPVDGEICELHEEDVVFDFTGDSPSQLTPGRYYLGTVDGYADFGVFVDIGPRVTGLLHRSELDRRLESLEWERGDDVCVQVLEVRDNGNVDLGWSIRQSPPEFRGTLIDTPEGERQPETDAGSDTTGAADEAVSSTSSETKAVANGGESAVVAETDDSGPDTQEDDSPLNRTTVDAIDAQVGAVVRLDGEITSVRQTSGPTVFELRDETSTVECAAFEEAGVRAYPDVAVGDIVSLEGEVENHYGDLQIETESLSILDGEREEAVRRRLEDALEAEIQPTNATLLAEYGPVAAAEEAITEAARTILRAVLEGRPIVVRHNTTADGHVAGAALERAVLPLLADQHTRDDAAYHYFDRRPLDGRIYGMDAATDDVTSMLGARNRHGEQLPLLVLVDAGATAESGDGYDLLESYGAPRLLIDDIPADDSVRERVSTAVTPQADADVTATAFAANVAAFVNDDVRGDLAHLPAISFWDVPPAPYRELATEAGYDETAIDHRREAVALEAYYQQYSDKRELIQDLLFDDDGDLAAHISEQFRAKLEDELETARANLAVYDRDGGTVIVLDTAAFTHRFDFPSTGLLVATLHRRERDAREGPVVTLGVDDDELRVCSSTHIDVRTLGETLEDDVPDAGVRVVGGRTGRIEFLTGRREAIEAAVIDAASAHLDD